MFREVGLNEGVFFLLPFFFFKIAGMCSKEECRRLKVHLTLSAQQNTSPTSRISLASYPYKIPLALPIMTYPLSYSEQETPMQQICQIPKHKDTKTKKAGFVVGRVRRAGWCSSMTAQNQVIWFPAEQEYNI